MTLDEALAYPFSAECPTGPGMTVGTAKQADWQWLTAKRECEAKAIMEAPLGTFVAVKDELLAEFQRRSFELASYVVREHVRLMQE
jgi:hypothetical protein